MSGDRWVALLRGLNVGGRNPLAMSELRATAESIGWDEVGTYIQSGNLAFTVLSESTEADLARALAAAVRDRHGLGVSVVVRSAPDIARIAGSHPLLDGPIEPKLLHVALLDEAPEADVVDRVPRKRFLPDTWTLDGREIYLAYPNGSGRSKLTIEVFERAWNVSATARNVNSIRRIADLAAN